MIVGNIKLKELIKENGLISYENNMKFDLDKVTCTSIDLCLSSKLIYKSQRCDTRIILNDNTSKLNGIIEDSFLDYTHYCLLNNGLVLNNKGYFLCQTKEIIKIPKGYVGLLEGRSTLARLGVSVHVTASKIDEGFQDVIVLEISSLNTNEIIIPFDYPICSLSLIKIEDGTSDSYNKTYYSGNNNKMIPIFK